MGQGQDLMKIPGIQELGLAVIEPSFSLQALADGTMPVAAGMIDVLFSAAVLALKDMSKGVKSALAFD